MVKKAQPISILGIGIGLIANSIKFFVDAKRQIVSNELFSDSIIWFIIFLTLGTLAIGYSFGRSSGQDEDKPKEIKRKRAIKSNV